MTAVPKKTRIRSRLGIAAGGLVLLLGGAAAGWAATTVFAPPDDVLDSPPFTFAEITPGEVGSSISLNAVAEWDPVPIGTNLAAGMVTSVAVSPGQEVRQGTILYTVNLRPVVIAKGETPAFRPLSWGVTGKDVAQLQSLLRKLGHYSGDIDGDFRGATQQAVRAWQKSLGLARDGKVQEGDVVFVPNLPTRVSLDRKKISRGVMLSGGEVAISGMPVSPSFTIPVTDVQAGLIPDGTRIDVTGPVDQEWKGKTAERVADSESDTVTIQVAGEAGDPLCEDECATIPVGEPSLLRSKVVIVEPVSGLTVPSAGLVTRADGTVAVVDEQGIEHEVTIIASARGMSVIEGVGAGLRVRVPASRQ